MKPIDISSSNSRIFKTLLRLKTARGIKKHRMAIVSGPRQVLEVAGDFPDRCRALVFSQDHTLPSIESIDHIPGYRLPGDLFSQIDLFDTCQPLLMVGFSAFPALMDTPWPPGCTLCLPFQDPANVGSAIRAAAAFGVSRVVMLKEAAHPFHPKAIRASGGNIFRVPIVEGPSLSDLALLDTPVITLSPKGEDVSRFRFPPTFCLVPGLEGPGVPDGLSRAQALSIPMKNRVESLNAAMATGIVLYLWQRGEKIGGLRNSGFGEFRA